MTSETLRRREESERARIREVLGRIPSVRTEAASARAEAVRRTKERDASYAAGPESPLVYWAIGLMGFGLMAARDNAILVVAFRGFWARSAVPPVLLGGAVVALLAALVLVDIWAPREASDHIGRDLMTFVAIVLTFFTMSLLCLAGE